MRLLLVAPLLGASGRVPDVFETLGPLLVEDGHEVTMTSPRTGSVSRAVDMAATVARRRGGADAVVVHLYSGRAFAVEDLVSRLARGRPRIGFLSGGGFPAFGERHPAWVRRVLDRFDGLVAPSAHLARWAETACSAPVAVIPNPLDVETHAFRLRSDPGPRLLWLRAYHPIYAPEIAVRAAAALVRTHPDLRLTMVGDDKGERAAVQALVADLGLDDHVRVGGFAGPEEKVALFADHDVFVNTSRVDNRPVSVVEAGAGGLCIVSTDVGGVPDLVQDGVSALLVPPDDPESLAAAVHRVLTEEGLAERLSAGGRKVAEAGRPPVVVELWRGLLDDLAR